MITPKRLKRISIVMLVVMLNQILTPGIALALTSGPSQPEVQSFEPFSTSEMVNLSTGDFTYNIPLMEIEGYPLNISYSSGVTMDQEASWVGLGWNINPGVINRNMRGIPDDYDGDVVSKEFSMKSNNTYGVSFLFGGEAFGIDLKKLGVSMGLNFNNYRGIGLDMSVSPNLASTSVGKGKMNASLGISLSSESGLGITPQLSFSKTIKDGEDKIRGVKGKIGIPFNSRTGITTMTFSVSQQVFEKPAGTKEKPTKGDVSVDADGNFGAKGDYSEQKDMASNGGSSIGFASQTYTPNISMPMLNVALSTSYTGGIEMFGIHPNTRINGYYSGQHVLGSSKTSRAYGYMNAQHGQMKNDAMMDFNREKDGGYSENTPSLPLTNFTYDVYSVSGQGIGGMYRPFRSDVGYVFDGEMNSYSINAQLPGIEIGGASAARGGLNFSVDAVNSRTGKWWEDNPIAKAFEFRDQGHNGDNLFEPFYFKQAGEKAIETDPDFVKRMGGFDAQRVEVLANFISMPTLNMLRNENKGESQVVGSDNFRKKRTSRNELIQSLKGEEASIIGLNKTIDVFADAITGEEAFDVSEQPDKNQVFKPVTRLRRASSHRKAHHISEISTYRTDGTRYVYGIPAYNLMQKEVTFALSPRKADETNGLVTYTKDYDNSPKNQNGTDHFFDRVTTPAYAHSYLLTAVLGANYVDLTDNGPSYDDLGGYTKFNYSLTNEGYQWRTPYEQNTATHNEGFKSQSLLEQYNDDKATYIYGKKEVWYMHSIETKNFVAVFHTSYRDDGLGVADENGGIADETNLPKSKLRRLEKIELYSRQDLIKNGIELAVPVKTVHFVYYQTGELCTNIGNRIDKGTSKGKLTLKEIYFTYGKSNKSRLSGYQFKYGQVRTAHGSEIVFNPSYNMKGYDRWSNYKETKGGTANPDCDPSPKLPLTSEFPYTDQGKYTGSCDYNGMYKADVNAHAWTLTSISLPSGGEVKVEYESDDYAYVQNKRAMQMVKVMGAFKESELSAFDPGLSKRNQLFEDITTGYETRNWIGFDITDYENSVYTGEDLKKLFFSEFDGSPMNYLYFKFLINLRGNKQEWVPGYLRYDKSNFKVIRTFGENPRCYGFVKLETQGAASYNQVSFAAWNFMRLHLPRLAYNQPDRNMDGVLQVFKALESMGNAIVQTFSGFTNLMVVQQCGRTFDTDKSFIRLYTPLNVKKGGGARVKRIRSIDNWDLLINGNEVSDYNMDYGQDYSYTTINEYNQTISSGVASYEPSIGGDENPFKQPVFYSEEKMLIPDDDYYQEEPYGESFFPSPNVVYSKVTVRSLRRENVKAHSTGKVVHEFYTAKDFPTITQRTSLHPVRMKPNPVLRLLSFVVEDYVTVSQGYSIELNDMHGKPKGQWVYAEQEQGSGSEVFTENPISGVQYKYKQSAPDRISNTFPVISKDGKITEAMVGVEIDQVADFREELTTSRSGGMGGNLDAFLVAVMPVAIPVLLPSYSSEKVRFRSAVVTKVINRYALLEETITYDGGTHTSQKNIALDAETGEVLLTQSTNVFGDVLYNFTYPAHWVYDNMGHGYKNINYFRYKPAIGTIAITDDPNLLVGDELLVSTIYGKMKGWVTEKDRGPGDAFEKKIIRANGVEIPLTEITYLKVIRSARKNQQTVPVGSLTQLGNPVNWTGTGTGVLQLNDNVLNSSAIEYSDDWKIFCECELAAAYSNDDGIRYNKLLRKRGGAWRPKTNWAYLTKRQQRLTNDNTSIRTDGTYENYDPFWTYSTRTGLWERTTQLQQWQYKTTGTIYSPYGLELESIDPLERYSAATYGYGNTLPTAVSGNARYREIGFDGFEDYGHIRCDEDHFSYKIPVKQAVDNDISIDASQSHTGKKSIKVKAAASARLTRKINTSCP